MESLKEAIFAGGCFWCTESDFKHLDGVVEVTSGYSGGHLENPTYQDVTSETSGHREAIKVSYDPSKISYEDLIRRLLTHIDPTDGGGQFHDRGESYEPVIFYQNEEEKKIAQENIAQLDASKIFEKPVAVKTLPYSNFYAAEEYHQDYSDKNNARYCAYRAASGRDEFIKKVWGDKTWITK